MLSTLRLATTRTRYTLSSHINVLRNSYVVYPSNMKQRRPNTKPSITTPTVPFSTHAFIDEAWNNENQANSSERLSILKPLMKFTVDGDICNPRGLFFVKPNNDKLLAAIHDKAYIMVTGHIGSGKTTRAWYALNNQLKEYLPVMVSLKFVDCTTLRSFWKSLGANIKRYCNPWPSYLPDIVDKETFMNFFLHYKGRRIVLFIDEFDILLQRKEAQESLCDALRKMKEVMTLSPTGYGLQAVVAISSFNIFHNSKKNLSPFNITDHWEVPYFSQEEVMNLLLDFQETSRVTLEDEVVQRIYSITSGHPLLVCFCGKIIHEILVSGSNRIVTILKWMEYESTKLARIVIPGIWKTVVEMCEQVKLPNYEQKENGRRKATPLIKQ